MSVNSPKIFNLSVSGFTIVLLTCVCFASGCSNKKENQYKMPENFLYDLNAPTQRFELPDELLEVSALSYFTDDKLVCVQDELGILFTFDLSTGKIADKITFGPDGDYEGVEVVNDTAYVIKSNGDLMFFPIQNPDSLKQIHTGLEEKNDVEGLGYDVNTKHLMIACKKKGDVMGNNIKGKAFYKFSLQSKELTPDPFFVIDKAKIADYPVEKINPSAIAMHPLTKEIYILSSKDKALVIVDAREIKNIILLDPALFEKPEGICFKPDGSLFISSEGKTGGGYILRFNN